MTEAPGQRPEYLPFHKTRCMPPLVSIELFIINDVKLRQFCVFFFFWRSIFIRALTLFTLLQQLQIQKNTTYKLNVLIKMCKLLLT